MTDIEVGNIDRCIICLNNYNLETQICPTNSKIQMCPAEKCMVYCCDNCKDQFNNWITINKKCPHCNERDLNAEETDDEEELIEQYPAPNKYLYYSLMILLFSSFSIPIIYYSTKNDLYIKLMFFLSIFGTFFALVFCFLYKRLYNETQHGIFQQMNSISLVAFILSIISLLCDTPGSTVMGYCILVIYYIVLSKLGYNHLTETI